jgi:hypothetical protein
MTRQSPGIRESGQPFSVKPGQICGQRFSLHCAGLCILWLEALEVISFTDRSRKVASQKQALDDRLPLSAHSRTNSPPQGPATLLTGQSETGTAAAWPLDNGRSGVLTGPCQDTAAEAVMQDYCIYQSARPREPPSTHHLPVPCLSFPCRAPEIRGLHLTLPAYS